MGMGKGGREGGMGRKEHEAEDEGVGGEEVEEGAIWLFFFLFEFFPFFNHGTHSLAQLLCGFKLFLHTSYCMLHTPRHTVQ